MMTRYLQILHRSARPGFARDESGAGTVFGLFLFMVIVIMSGLALDGSNAWRNATHLNASADAASHAGAVALANGGDEAAVRAAAVEAAAINMPVGRYGDVVADAVQDIQLMHFDTTTRSLSNVGDRNAVVVTLHQTAANQNAVRTYFLRLMGVDSWNVLGQSIAVYDASAECNNTDGVYADDEISLSSQNYVGPGFCVHSQKAVWLPQQNSFGEGSVVSMPNLDDCKSKCTDAANPGISPMALNMILPDFGEYIMSMHTEFGKNIGDSLLKSAWFNAKKISASGWQANVKPLGDIGIKTAKIDIGSVVNLTWDQFHALPVLPYGLVYNVDCKNNGNSGKTTLTFDGSTSVMHDSVLLTDCSLYFGEQAEVIGSLIVTTREQSAATVTSGSDVTVADPSQACHDDQRTTVMSMGKVSVPAKFVMSNVTLVVDDDVDIASASSNATTSRGLSIYASGTVSLSSQHELETCGGSNLLAPTGRVIRHVMASAAL